MANLTTQEKKFIAAARWNEIESLQQLIIDKVNINIQSEKKDTALHWAVYQEHVESTKILIDVGANLDIQDNKGYTALISSIYDAGRTNITELLINAGANLDIRNNEGKTALDIAREEGLTEKIVLLEATAAKRTTQDRIKRNAGAMTSAITALQDRPRRSAPALKRRQHKR